MSKVIKRLNTTCQHFDLTVNAMSAPKPSVSVTLTIFKIQEDGKSVISKKATAIGSGDTLEEAQTKGIEAVIKILGV